MPTHQSLSRRTFLLQSALAGSGLALGKFSAPDLFAAGKTSWPIAEFSKIYQELKLSFDESAEVTAEVGLDGIDCPVRPGGQVLPERVGEDLPRYEDALKKRNVKLLLLTTAIQGPSSPHAETILRTAKKFGVKYYRTGYWKYDKKTAAEKTLAETKAQLKDLAALNQELGMCAVLQNHAGDDLVGAKLLDYWEIVKGIDAQQVAIAFDIGHALHTLGQDWRAVFQTMQSHLGVVYVKDFKRGGDFVAFGQGDIANTDFFKLVKKTAYQAPVSMHTEYNWSNHGKDLTRTTLIKTMKRDLQTLTGWINEA